MQPRWFGRRNIWRKSPQRILLSLPPITICTLSSYHLPTTPRFSQNCNALCPATPTAYLKFRLSRLDPSRQARPPPNFNVVTVFPFVIQQPRRKKNIPQVQCWWSIRGLRKDTQLATSVLSNIEIRGQADGVLLMYEIRAVTLGIEVGVWGSTVGRGECNRPNCKCIFLFNHSRVKYSVNSTNFEV